jgi:hypothetical protein
VGKNFMREAMPQDETMDGFGNLQALGIHHCSLTGKIPTWVSKTQKPRGIASKPQPIGRTDTKLDQGPKPSLISGPIK